MFLGIIKFYTQCFVLIEMYIVESSAIVLEDSKGKRHRLTFYSPEAAEKGFNNIWKCLTQNGHCSVDRISLETGEMMPYGEVFNKV